jgi:hypothetical protein
VNQIAQSDRIYYRAGYKYCLAKPAVLLFSAEDGLRPASLGRVCENDWAHLDFLGEGVFALHIRKGYAWDGASGPARDTRSVMLPSLGHDCLYQFISGGLLHPAEAWVSAADVAFRHWYTEVTERQHRRGRWPLAKIRSQVTRWRAAWMFWAVDRHGHARPEDERPVLSAP